MLHLHSRPPLKRDNFADLGHAFPKPEAATREDLVANLTYFRRELRRLSASIAWTNDVHLPDDVVVSFKSVVEYTSLPSRY